MPVFSAMVGSSFEVSISARATLGSLRALMVLRQVTEVYPCTLTFQVSVQDPVYKTVDTCAAEFAAS